MKNCSQVKTLRKKSNLNLRKMGSGTKCSIFWLSIFFLEWPVEFYFQPSLYQPSADAQWILWLTLHTPYVCLSAPSCVRQRSSHSATRPASSTTSTVRWWVCLWTLTSPTWRGSTLHARYCLISHLFSMRVWFMPPAYECDKCFEEWVDLKNAALIQLYLMDTRCKVCHLLIWAIICNVLRLTLLAAATVQTLIWQVLIVFRLEVWATSTSPSCLTSTSRSPETMGCCWRVQASHSGGGHYYCYFKLMLYDTSVMSDCLWEIVTL